MFSVVQAIARHGAAIASSQSVTDETHRSHRRLHIGVRFIPDCELVKKPRTSKVAATSKVACMSKKRMQNITDFRALGVELGPKYDFII